MGCAPHGLRWPCVPPADLCRPETVCRFLCFRCSSASSCSCRTRSLALTSLRPRGTIYEAEASGQLTGTHGHKPHLSPRSVWL